VRKLNFFKGNAKQCEIVVRILRHKNMLHCLMRQPNTTAAVLQPVAKLT
jgi:hypothetical protein